MWRPLRIGLFGGALATRAAALATLARHDRPVSAWRKNSRNKISRGDARCFEESGRSGDADELLCRVGAWIAWAAPDQVPRKELFEAHAVARIVDSRFPGSRRVAELCAGCGLLAVFLALLDPGRTIRCVDRRQPALASRLMERMDDQWPALAAQVRWEEHDIRCAPEGLLGRDELVVSCHACGLLTDEVMVAAMAGKMLRPLVLVPCCHEARPSLPRPQPWMPRRSWGLWPWLQGGAVHQLGGEAVDGARADYLKHVGYHVIVDHIDPAITPANRAIIAEPPLSSPDAAL